MDKFTYKSIGISILILGYVIGLINSAYVAKSYVPFTARYIDNYVQEYPLDNLIILALFILVGYGLSLLVIYFCPSNKRPCLWLGIASLILFSYNFILFIFTAIHIPNYFASFYINNFIVAIILFLLGIVFFIHRKFKEVNEM